MKYVFAFALACVVPAVVFISGQEAPKEKTATTTRVWRPNKVGDGHFVHFIPRAKMIRAGGVRIFDCSTIPDFKAPTLPIDWAKSTPFLMYGNDRYGDCYYAAICHADNTFTGANGPVSVFNLQSIINRYLSLSGGDNGLSDGDVIPEWKNRGLADVPDAKIVDMMYLTITDPVTVQTAMANFGPIMFTFSVPNAWINNSNTGDLWDAPATANPNNGHAVIFNGVDVGGKYKLQTWGTYVWITAAGVRVCEPDGWVTFSKRWFSPKGYAPNGKHITELATLWTQAGGKAIAADVINSFPPPGDVPPDPGPGPDPVPGSGSRVILSGKDLPGTYQLIGPGQEVVPKGTRAKIAELSKMLGGSVP